MGSKSSFFQSLYAELKLPLTRFLAKRVSDPEDAHDIAQEAFLRIYRLKNPEKLDNARAFLFKTASNLAVDQLRHQNVHARYVNSELKLVSITNGDTEMTPSVERIVEAEQLLALIYQTVEALPANCRRAFLYHRARGMTYNDIAREMGISASSVEKYIIQALRHCRKRLREAETETTKKETTNSKVKAAVL